MVITKTKYTTRSLCFIFYFFTLLVLLFFCNISNASSKVDTVYFQSGDRITGEVKSLENAILTLKTDDASTLTIKWVKVDSIYIHNSIRLTLQNGDVRYGKISPSGKLNECLLNENNGSIEKINLWSIVEIVPLEKGILQRLSGTISSGLNYTSASKITQLDVNGSIQYKGEKVILHVNYNLTISKDALQTTQRQNGSASLYRLLKNKWSLHAKAGGESNSEFKLDLRTTLGAGGNYNFIQSSSQKLGLMAGLLVNNELSGDLSQNNLEGTLTLTYELYLLVKPEITLSFQGDIIPSFTVKNRVRSEMDSNMKWKILKDFYLKYTVFNSVDNKPLSGVDVHRVWGTTLGLEYKF